MKISTVVPVYNAEKYVSKCIDSILNQTYQNWELWLVDDGSQDDSLSVLKKYAEKDNRINVIHQENAGAGMARNAAISKISGDYIVFVDSDDYIEKDYFSLIVEKNTDVVFLDVLQRNEKDEILKEEYLSKYSKYGKDDVIRFQMTGKMPWGGVRKAVKTSIVKDNHISFSKHKVGEEAIYSFLVLFYAKTFSFIEKPVYNYVQHEDSLSHTILDDPWGDVTINMKNKLVELGVYDVYASTMNAFFVRAAVGSLYKLAQKYDFINYKVKSSERYEKMKLLLDSNYRIDWKYLDKRAVPIYLLMKFRLMPLLFLVTYFRRK